MTTAAGTEALLRDLAPRVLGTVLRRCGSFAHAGNAVQEALLAAAASWSFDGQPDTRSPGRPVGERRSTAGSLSPRAA